MIIRRRHPLAPCLATAAALALVASACGGSPSTSDGSIATTAPVVPATPTSEAAPTPTSRPPQLAVDLVGEPELVFDYSTDRCNDDMRPDLPARAWRNSSGDVSLLLSAPANYRLVGRDLDSLEPDCVPIFTSAFAIDPAQHSHFEWLAATYTDDGETVHGIVHNEYHGYEAHLADSRQASLTPATDTSNSWSYLARSNGASTPMVSASSGYQRAGSLCSIDFWGAHPDTGCDAVRRWTPDRSSEVVVETTASLAGQGGGNGVEVGLDVNGTTVWVQRIEAGDPATYAEAQSLTVEAGDQLDFWVSAVGEASFDATNYEVVVTADGQRCTGDTWACTQVGLAGAVSVDGGTTWTRPDPSRRFVAGVGEQYRHDAGMAAVWQPTNIVRHPTDGYYYMLVQYDYHRGRDAQHTCVVRTNELDNPSAWRAWDGEAFALAFVDPYQADVNDADPSLACASVMAAPMGGLSWNTYLNRFVAVGGFTQFGPTGHYLTTSEDLVTWSVPVLIAEAEFVYTSDVGPYEPYGTLIDPASESPSYDTTGQFPYLYFTRINNQQTLDYDLVRVRLELSQ